MRIIGRVSETERDQIKELYERKNGLIELAKTLSPDSALYEKLVKDMGATTTRYQDWWDSMSEKYKWESLPEGRWSINFDTCEISLE